MSNMNRRNLLRLWSSGVFIAISGCSGRSDEPPPPTLSLFPRIERNNAAWNLEVRVRSDNSWGTSIHNVIVVAFDHTGGHLCQKAVGDFFENDDSNRTVAFTCKRFPAIITAIAEESPCDGARIRLLFYIGDDESREKGEVNDASLWEGTYRECNESLPPERVLKNVSQSNSANYGE